MTTPAFTTYSNHRVRDVRQPVTVQSMVLFNSDEAKLVLDALFERSCWFEWTPLPDDEWEVRFKRNEGINTLLYKVLGDEHSTPEEAEAWAEEHNLKPHKRAYKSCAQEVRVTG